MTPPNATTREPFPTRLLVLLGALTALAPLSIDMYLPALPSIGEAFRVDDASARWTLSAFMAGLGVGQLVYGPLSDRVGRRTPLLVGLVGFIAGSVGCALAPGLPWLIGARLLQALGGAAGVVLGRAIVRDHASGAEAARLMSTLILIMGVAPIVAPSLGSAVLAVANWRAIFGVVAVAGLVGWAASASWLPDGKRAGPTTSVLGDFRTVLGDPAFLSRALANAAGGAGMFAYISSAPFVFMDGYGLSERAFALVFGLNAMGFIAASQVNGRIAARFGPARLFAGASVVMLLSGLSLLALGEGGADLPWLWGALVWAFIASLGFVLPNSTVLALENHGPRAGSASALIGCVQYAFAGVTTALIGFLPGTAQGSMAGVMAGAAAVVFGAGVLAQWVEGRKVAEAPAP